ncbi:class I SAM-dependent methyltransferase [Hydrogenovibrio kuenenii]|uniref:class I SAM-dependent methyltransferase n=1 Tax=Hydrogenovibrio kuenenii TaxID=63658 RepID=UPI000464F992|nr:methyltransferase domain-containing protein [Hydrogenovibrio kuenenii]
MNTAEKWDQKYLNHDPKQPVIPAWVLRQHPEQLPLKGKALDLACGLGGNARFMAQCGLSVEAWDISDIALTELNNWAAVNRLPIKPTLCDLDQMLLPYQQFDVITVSFYLNRQLFPQIEQALKPCGKLFYQTYLGPIQDNAPSNPNFYLKSSELGKAFPSLVTEVYGEGLLPTLANTAAPNHDDKNSKTTRQAWYIGQKPLN